MVEFIDNAKNFLTRYKIGAIAGAALPLPIAFLASLQTNSLFSTVFVGESIMAGTIGLVLNVVIGAFIGAGIQWALKEYADIG